jgi:hypothetical protein
MTKLLPIAALFIAAGAVAAPVLMSDPDRVPKRADRRRDRRTT